MLFSLTTIICSVLFISFMVFVAFFGRLPALRNTPIATLHKVLWVHIPNVVLAVDQALTGGRFLGGLARFGTYLFTERHWTIVIFFLLILIISEYMYLPHAWPHLGALTKLSVVITVILPYLFLYLACAADPGYISPENLDYHLALYPYDHTLFHPGHECRTCRTLKPARSKHCSICKRCISRADHHCIFINSCVGYGNHHYFLLLLFTTGFLASYGAFLGMSLISASLERVGPGWSLWPSRQLSLTENLAVWGWAIQDNVNIGATTLLATLISPLIWGLFVYNLWLVYCGTTTNETLKWSEWKEDMRDGYAFRRSMPANRRKNEHIEPRKTRWPVETEQVLIATNNGCPPAPDAPLQGEGPWEKVWSLEKVENLYDMGFRDNLMDIFIPNYAFGSESEEPGVELRRRTP